MPIAPEQIIACGDVDPVRGALVDRWGRLHRIGDHAQLGRSVSGAGLLILHGSVSRAHAVVELVQQRWMLHDAGSTNGTKVNGRLVDSPVALAARDRIGIGPATFFFLTELDRVSHRPSVRTTATTMHVFGRLATSELEPESSAPLRSASFVLQQPTGGGSGLVAIDGKSASLTLLQFELLAILEARMLADEAMPPETRGFVPAAFLVERLSLTTSGPTDEHIRQLVMRLRRTLAKAGIGRVIDSRQGLGYRLSLIPKVRK